MRSYPVMSNHCSWLLLGLGELLQKLRLSSYAHCQISGGDMTEVPDWAVPG